MSSFRFAQLTVVLSLLSNSAIAQGQSQVPSANEIDVAHVGDAGDDFSRYLPQPYLHGDDVSKRWVLTDESIDGVASERISEFEKQWGDPTMDADGVGDMIEPVCTCGQNHCHGVCRDPGHPKKPWITKPGDRDRGDCPPLRYRMNDCERAGNPHCYHRWAKCSVTDKYSAWFVGGGSPFVFGRPRTSSEGTWGLDYGGFFGHAKVWLNYTRGRNQGGAGAYRTDGEPKIVSRVHDVIHHAHE